jgi:hypothetical protein
MKSLPSAQYLAKFRTWSFAVTDHDRLVQAVQPMKQVIIQTAENILIF